MDDYKVSEHLGNLLVKAVEIDLDHLRNQRIVQPWLLTADKMEGNVEMSVFTGLDHVDAKNEVRKMVQEKLCYVFGFDGHVSLTTGEKINGLFYEIGERSQKTGFNYMVGHERQIDGSIQILEEYNGFRGETINLIS